MITFGATSWSQAIENLLTEKDKGQPLYADSAYTGEEQEKVYKKKKANNKEKSRTHARVEHIFGFVENSMNGSFVRNIGIARAKAKIGMMNLTYNICRCVQLKIAVSMG